MWSEAGLSRRERLCAACVRTEGLGLPTPVGAQKIILGSPDAGPGAEGFDFVPAGFHFCFGMIVLCLVLPLLEQECLLCDVICWKYRSCLYFIGALEF